MSKKIGIILIIVMCVLLGGIFLLEKGDQKKRADQISSVENEVKPIQKEINDLETALVSNEAQYNKDRLGKGSLSFVFTDLNNDTVKSASKILKEKNLTGTLAISDKQYPGMEGCITQKTFDELLDDGWSYCLYWDANRTLKKWLPIVESKLKQKKLPMPQALYCVAEEYYSKDDSLLLEYGINIVIHHGEEDLPLAATEDKEDVFHLGAVAWNASEAESTMQSAISECGSLVLSVGSDIKAENYDETSFENLMEQINEWKEDKTIQVIDLYEAAKYRKKLEEKREKLEEEYTAQKEETEEKLEELKQQKQDIYDNAKWS